MFKKFFITSGDSATKESASNLATQLLAQYSLFKNSLHAAHRHTKADRERFYAGLMSEPEMQAIDAPYLRAIRIIPCATVLAQQSSLCPFNHLPSQQNLFNLLLSSLFEKLALPEVTHMETDLQHRLVTEMLEIFLSAWQSLKCTDISSPQIFQELSHIFTRNMKTTKCMSECYPYLLSSIKDHQALNSLPVLEEIYTQLITDIPTPYDVVFSSISVADKELSYS